MDHLDSDDLDLQSLPWESSYIFLMWNWRQCYYICCLGRCKLTRISWIARYSTACRCLNSVEGIYNGGWQKVSGLYFASFRSILGSVAGQLPFSSLGWSVVCHVLVWYCGRDHSALSVWPVNIRYYYNKVTKLSKWTMPEEMKVSIMISLCCVLSRLSDICDVYSWCLTQLQTLGFYFPWVKCWFVQLILASMSGHCVVWPLALCCIKGFTLFIEVVDCHVFTVASELGRGVVVKLHEKMHIEGI